MSLRAWFQPPRRWLGLFLLLTLAPSSLLIWFGWRLLRQDRALALQQVQDRREQAADLIVAGLEQSLEKLNAQNRYALAFRVHNMKTEAGRKKKIATFVEMLKRGDTIYPQEVTKPGVRNLGEL